MYGSRRSSLRKHWVSSSSFPIWLVSNFLNSNVAARSPSTISTHPHSARMHSALTVAHSHLYTYSAADTLETSHGYVLASTRNSAVLVFHFSLLAATILLCWYFTSPAIAPLLRGRGRNRMGGAFLPRQRPKLNITKTKHLQL